MKIQFAVVLKDHKGRDIDEADPRDKTKLNKIQLGDIVCTILNIPLELDKARDKKRNFELMCKISAAQEKMQPLELLDDDIEFIEDRLGKIDGLTAIQYGAAVRALKTPVPDEKSE